MKIGLLDSIWNENKRGVPQGSTLGPLLFNAFINDIFMFIEKTEICNFADDNTIYDCGEDLSNILENLKHDLRILLKLFKINFLQANPGKFQFVILGKKKRNSVKLIINTTEIENSRKVVLLGITIDNLLIFNEHIDNLCRTANYKLHALRRIRKYLSLEKAKLLCNAFINSQFKYAPLVWMFCRKKQYLKIQKIPHKALKVVYNSNKNYDELLRNNNEVLIYQSHLRALISEFFKSLNNLEPE